MNQNIFFNCVCFTKWVDIYILYNTVNYFLYLVSKTISKPLSKSCETACKKNDHRCAIIQLPILTV